MTSQIVINPGKCTGCSSCALTCSLINYGEFNLNKSNIRIIKHDFEGIFQISFLSTCRNCGQCATVCPSGALQSIKIPAHENGSPVKGGINQ